MRWRNKRLQPEMLHTCFSKCSGATNAFNPKCSTHVSPNAVAQQTPSTQNAPHMFLQMRPCTKLIPAPLRKLLFVRLLVPLPRYGSYYLFSCWCQYGLLVSHTMKPRQLQPNIKRTVLGIWPHPATNCNIQNCWLSTCSLFNLIFRQPSLPLPLSPSLPLSLSHFGSSF